MACGRGVAYGSGRGVACGSGRGRTEEQALNREKDLTEGEPGGTEELPAEMKTQVS